MPETRFTESEAILFAVREDDDGLEEYLADRERFSTPELWALCRAARDLAAACRVELEERGPRDNGPRSSL
jgi:hypothetical protein